jgi:hypothetical protein
MGASDAARTPPNLPQGVESPDGGATAAAARRWLESLHESGHVQAARVLFGAANVAVLHPDGGASTSSDFDDGPLHARAAIYAAAGQAAERLADTWPPPCPARFTEDRAAQADEQPLPRPATAAEVAAVGMPDADAVDYSGWRLAVPDDLIHRWRDFARDCARDLIDRHAMRVVCLATRLYRTGRLTLTPSYIEPTEPARVAPATTPAEPAIEAPAEPAERVTLC